MQKVRGHSEELPLFVGTRFQVLFHSPLGVLFTFPSRYLFTIGQLGVLSLGRWSSQIPPGFHVSEGTQERTPEVLTFRVRGYHPLCRSFPAASTKSELCNSVYQMQLIGSTPYNTEPATPARLHWVGLGYSPFARHY